MKASVLAVLATLAATSTVEAQPVAVQQCGQSQMYCQWYGVIPRSGGTCELVNITREPYKIGDECPCPPFPAKRADHTGHVVCPSLRR
jgi:hypothetical protein